jgi:hypothetical protein
LPPRVSLGIGLGVLAIIAVSIRDDITALGARSKLLVTPHRAAVGCDTVTDTKESLANYLAWEIGVLGGSGMLWYNVFWGTARTLSRYYSDDAGGAGGGFR